MFAPHYSLRWQSLVCLSLAFFFVLTSVFWFRFIKQHLYFVYGIWVVFCALSLWKTSHWYDCGVTVTEDICDGRGRYKVHTKYVMGMGDIKFIQNTGRRKWREETNCENIVIVWKILFGYILKWKRVDVETHDLALEVVWGHYEHGYGHGFHESWEIPWPMEINK
jgi:hypothetical protein